MPGEAPLPHYFVAFRIITAGYHPSIHEPPTPPGKQLYFELTVQKDGRPP